MWKYEPMPFSLIKNDIWKELTVLITKAEILDGCSKEKAEGRAIRLIDEYAPGNYGQEYIDRYWSIAEKASEEWINSSFYKDEIYKCVRDWKNQENQNKSKKDFFKERIEKRRIQFIIQSMKKTTPWNYIIPPMVKGTYYESLEDFLKNN